MTTLEDEENAPNRAVLRDLPLLGISMDDHDGEDQIVIMLGDQTDRNLTHIVPRPTEARMIDESNAQEETIEIETQTGRRVILHCHPAV